MIPAKVLDQGRPFSEVVAEIKKGIRDQCGGTLCLTLSYAQEDDPNYTACQFIRTQPAQRELVERGSTVWIFSGKESCEGDSKTPQDPQQEQDQEQQNDQDQQQQNPQQNEDQQQQDDRDPNQIQGQRQQGEPDPDSDSPQEQ